MTYNNHLHAAAADNIRTLAVSMVEKAKSGHPGGAMGGADFIDVLYSEFLVEDPDDATWRGRDRFFLDPGHMSPMLYAELALTGRFTIEELKNFRQWGSPTTGHPERNILRGIENTSGPLGQGHTYAVGAALAAKCLYARTGNPAFLRERVFAYISDGGVQEEISQGAGRMAGHLKLGNLIMFYDANEVQLSTKTNEVCTEDTAKKYEAWGWRVLTINGNDVEEIRQALRTACEEQERPTLIIGRCIMAKGARQGDGTSYEGSVKTHGAPLGAEAWAQTVKNLGASVDDPFAVRPEVAEMYAQRNEALRAEVAALRAEERAWEEANPAEAARLADWFEGRLPEIPWERVQQKPNGPTRAGSAECLALLSEVMPNMIVASADLCNSDKTDGFLRHTSNITAENYAGGFLQAGVAELTMACVCIGAMLHGGIVCAMGTFFVFSDYMKPAIRMAALMEVPVKFVWSHDAFRVGEDGPTHEPVEQEAQIRLMEQLRNHSGRDSVRVFRPADVHEATECWRLAMENQQTPTALIFTRQNVNDLPEGTIYNKGVARGAYVVADHPEADIILVASGSEVSTLVEAAKLLEADDVHCRVVSAPSEGLFRRQSKEYQEATLPEDMLKFGLTAGLPCTLRGLVGTEARIHGMESFGYSAPYKVLEEKFGFTPAVIAEEVKEFLDDYDIHMTLDLV